MVPDRGPLEVILTYGVFVALNAPSVEMATGTRFVVIDIHADPHVDGLP